MNRYSLFSVRRPRISSSTAINDELGSDFVDPPQFDLRASYNISTCETPIVFVLTTGADPMTILLRLANEEGYTTDNGKLFSISLGQGACLFFVFEDPLSPGV